MGIVDNYKLKMSKGEMTSDNLAFWFLVQLTDIAIKQFKYKGMPAYMPIDIIERYLFNEGRALFFQDDALGYFALPTAAFSKFNEYGLPIEYQAIGFNGKTWRRDITNSVLIKNTPLLSPCLPVIYQYCKELANIRMAMNVNVNSTKTPFIFSGSKEELLTLKNVYKKISDNEPVTYVDTGLVNNLKALNTQAPFVADKLDQLFTSTLGKALTYLGINNTQVEKQERLTNDEVNSNNEFINANLLTRLDCRKDACEEINKMFGLNISVELNKNFNKELAMFLQNLNQEGDKNGN